MKETILPRHTRTSAFLAKLLKLHDNKHVLVGFSMWRQLLSSHFILWNYQSLEQHVHPAQAATHSHPVPHPAHSQLRRWREIIRLPGNQTMLDFLSGWDVHSSWPLGQGQFTSGSEDLMPSVLDLIGANGALSHANRVSCSWQKFYFLL